MNTPAASWVRSAVDLVFPRNCQICTTALEESEHGVICAACLGTVKWIEPPFCRQCASPFAGAVTGEMWHCGYCQDLHFQFSQAVAATRAEGVVRDAIHRLKYNREMYYATHLQAWLLAAAQRWIDWRAWDGIVPVPLHPRKHREREFNQATVLAEALGAAVNRPVWPTALRRVKDTATQTKLHAKERTQNLRGAFVARRADSVAGKRVVLVDDVFTTGATLDGCAKVLRVAGAVDVLALTVARGI